MLLGVDVGGTFTDAVLLDGTTVHSAKAPTTPHDQSCGVMDAITTVLERAGAGAENVERFAHGTTTGTNALLERRGTPTLLIATEGFTDLLEIARQNRPSLYRLSDDRPPPLSPADLRIGVRERIGAEGVIEALTEIEVDRVVEEVRRLDPGAVAICLLFTHRDDSHEATLAAALRRELPGLHVSASSEVLPRFREYERCSTTVLDAYLAPVLGTYLKRLGERCVESRLPKPAVMQSSGGIASSSEATRGGAWSVLSGPAGGAVGAGLLAGLSGDGDALGFDMGGTSCDVCVVEDGAVRRTAEREFAGRPIQLPMVDVHTVGAGGGSLAWIDSGGALRVGPRSAGAEPGPACYGRGGTGPTVTDANLLLGYLGAGAALAGGVELDRGAAAAAIAPLADELGLGEEEAARGILDVADAEMVRAMRVVTVERGVDPRGFALLPFGGAGPLHAAAVATELGITRIICPRSGGVLSALGLVAGARRRETAHSVLLGGGDLHAGRIAAEVASLVERLDPGAEDELEAGYELRYRGQGFELSVPGELEPNPAELAERFAAEHERRYGYSEDDGAVELVTIRLAAIGKASDLGDLSPGSGKTDTSSREAWFGGEWVDAEVVRGQPAEGLSIAGPGVVELPETTLLLPPGWRAEVDAHGSLVAEHGERR